MASKRRGETLKNEGTDRISDLPDPILGKIISYLPTKYAVATSIVSTRWKNVFAFVVPPLKLDLDEYLLLRYPEKSSSSSSSFVDFVDKLFNKTLSDVTSVDTLILKCSGSPGGAKIISWVCAALHLNVQFLDLDILLDDPSSLFPSLHGCTTLASLVLGGGFGLCLPDDLSLPNLKSLTLNSFDLDNHKINGLIDGCPVLESLHMCNCCFENADTIYIRSPLLKRFAVQNDYGYCDEPARRLMLDAPNLRVLLYDEWRVCVQVVSDFKSLYSADIGYGLQLDVDDGPDAGLAKLTTACSGTVHLCLASCTIDALHHMSVDLPTFQNLTWLKLGFLVRLGWGILARLLCNTPNLEKLVFEEGFEKSEGGYADFESFVSTPPICLELHLKEIDFLDFEDEEDEFKLIEYLLKNGKVMQKLKLYLFRPVKNSCSLNRLHRLSMKPTIFIESACWKDELLLKYMSSHSL